MRSRALVVAAAAALRRRVRLGRSAASAPAEAAATDTPNDGGRSITVRWAPPADSAAALDAKVVIERVAADGVATEVGHAPLAAGVFVDGSTAEGSTGPEDGRPFTYRLRTTSASDSTAAAGEPIVTAPAVSQAAVLQYRPNQCFALARHHLRVRDREHPAREARRQVPRAPPHARSTRSKKRSAAPRKWGARCSTSPGSKKSRTFRRSHRC